jgi:mycothiol synthase
MCLNSASGHQVSPVISIRPRVGEDDAAIVEISNQVQHDLPPTDVEDFRYRLKMTTEGSINEWWVADDGDVVVGSLSLTNAFYSQSPGTFYVGLDVRPALWRGGIGRQLAMHLAECARQHHATRLYLHIRDDLPEARAFAERRGWAPSGRVAYTSRLPMRAHIQTLDVGTRVPELPEGLRIATLAEIGMDNEAMIHAIYLASEESAKDVPRSEPRDMFTFERWIDIFVDSPGNSLDAVWVALHGDRPVGIARVVREGGAAWSAYTGVLREYRGRGIAQALKARTIAWCAEADIPYLYTENDIDNRAMLAVNQKVGYESLPAAVEYVKHLDG